MRKRLIAAALGVGLLSGCGYTTRAFVAKTGYHGVYVRPFENKVDTTSEESVGGRFQTYFPLLENRITNAVVDRFLYDGELRVVPRDDADIVLSGELVDYRRDSLRDANDDTPQEYRITLFVNIRLEDSKTGKLLWEKKGFAGETSYYTTGSYVKTEAQALEDAVADLARRIVETTVEIW
ncbi:MAG: LPS assembly lipoprotein LptE [Deltaproteobacteria bacterium]